MPFRAVFFLILFFAWTTFGVAAQTPTPRPSVRPSETVAEPLAVGGSVERALRGREVRAFAVELEAGQFLDLNVVQKGIDAVVLVFNPSGAFLGDFDAYEALTSVESVAVVAKASGAHRVEVRAAFPTALTGKIEVAVGGIRTPSEADLRRAEAFARMAEGERLRRQGGAESPRLALAEFETAADLFQKAGDRRGQASVLLRIALVHRSRGDAPSRSEANLKALELFRSAGDKVGEAKMLLMIGSAVFERADYSKAREFLDAALVLAEQVGDLDIQGDVVNLFGGMAGLQGDVFKQIELYERAAMFFRRFGDSAGTASTLVNLTQAYENIGELEKSLDCLQRMLDDARNEGNSRREGVALNNIGTRYAEWGNPDRALDYFSEALAVRRKAGDVRGEGVTLLEFGRVYRDLDDDARALDFFKRALELARKTRSASGEADALSEIGNIHLRRKEFGVTLEYFNQVLELRRKREERDLEINALRFVASAHAEAGNREKAVEVYNQALALARELGIRLDEAPILSSLGNIALDAGDLPLAAERFQAALDINRALGFPHAEAESNYKTALVREAQDRLPEALVLIEETLSIVESVRAKLVNPDYRGSYLSKMQAYYDCAVRIRMKLHALDPKAGHGGAALLLAERAKARYLIELLRQSRTDIRKGVDPELFERERKLRQKLSAQTERLTSALSDGAPAEEIAAVKRDIAALSNEYKSVQLQVMKDNPRVAAVTQPVPPSVAEIQGLSDPRTVILEYRLGDSESRVWAVTPNGVETRRLASRERIEAAALRWAELLQKRPKTDAERSVLNQAAADLGHLVLDPVADMLDVSRVALVLDGALHFTPFAALPAPKPDNSATHTPQRKIQRSSTRAQLLIERCEVVVLPSIAALKVIREGQGNRPTPTKTLAVIADPVFSTADSRISGSDSTRGSVGLAQAELPETRNLTKLPRNPSAIRPASVRELPRLVWTRREAEAISSLVPPEKRFTALGFAASRETVEQTDLSEFRFVHFATHGYCNTERPELSGIVLSLVDERGRKTDGFFLAGEVFNLNLNADLVVLSACQTGVGKIVSGEGLVGLTRAFLFAGTPRLAVSLWDVSDRATADLMDRFYQAMLRARMSPAAALRKAQLEMLKSRRLRDPYYWAAFQLQGEWK